MFAFEPLINQAMKQYGVDLSGESKQTDKVDWDNLDFTTDVDVEDKRSSNFLDWDNIDLSLDTPIKQPLDPGESFYIDKSLDISKPEIGIYEGLIKPTSKALFKVPTTVASSMALLPGAGIAALIDLVPTINPDPDKAIEFGSLDDAIKTFNQVMAIPSKLITTPEEQKAIENISLAMKPIEMAGEGWRLIGEQINNGLRSLGLPADTYLEPLLGTYGEVAAIFALPNVIKKVGSSNWYRGLTIKERGLVVQSLADTMKKNPNMSEGQLLRTYDNPLWRTEALSKRSITESYGEMKRWADQKVSEAIVENVMETKKKSPPKPKSEIRPAEVNPEYTFTSQKGNYFEKIGDKWYNQKGEEVTNRFVISAAERGKVEFGIDEDAASDALIAELETRYNKNIDNITDKQIKDYIIEKETTPKQPKLRYEGEQEGLGSLYTIMEGPEKGSTISAKTLNERGIKAEERGKVEEPKVIDISDMSPAELKMFEALARVEKEPTTDLDLQTGTREPIESTSFRQLDKELTKEQLKSLPPYERIDNVDSLIARMEMEVNAWLDGEIVDIISTKRLIEQLSDSSKKWAEDVESPPGIFEDMTLTELENFSEYMGQLDSWARKAKRPSGGGDIQLNMMIPVNEIPGLVKELLGKSKILVGKYIQEFKKGKILTSDVYRNREIFDKTGFWLGKDGKWRYEIDDSKVKFKKGFVEGDRGYLTDFIDHPELFKNVPGAKDIKVYVRNIGASSGVFVDSVNGPYIEISPRGKGIHKTFIHEIQHAVNTKAGAFEGSSPEAQLSPGVRDAFTRYQKAPGEMEARLAERRMNMTAKQRKRIPPWETLEQMLVEEGITTLVDPRSTMTKSESGTKLYDIGGAVGEGAKQIFNKLTGRDKTKVNDKPPDPFKGVKEDARELIFKRAGGLGVATYETNKFVNSIEQRTNKLQREVMPFVIEKTDIPDELGRPDLQEVIKRDIKYLEPIAEEVKAHFNQGFKKVKAHLKDLTIKQIDDYVTHLWDIPKNKKAEAVHWFQTQDRFMERRFIPTYKEGIEKGFIPKTLDISEIIKIHDNVGNRAIENTKYLNALLAMEKNGIKLINRSDEAPLDWVEVDYPALTRRIPLKKTQIKRKGEFVKEVKVRVHPDLVRPLKAIFEERFDHPVISAYEALNGIMKKSMLTLSLFHHGALGETGIALIGPKKTAELMFNPVKIYQSIVKGDYEIFKKEAIARDGIEHLLQLGATADIPVGRIQKYLEELTRVTQDVPMVNKITKFLEGTNSVWDKALWSYLHDTLKLYGYETLVGKLDPNMSSEMTRKAKIEIAQLVNDTFGGQNWDTLMITPKEIQMMTWSLLSSDWTISTTRQALAPTGIGKVYKETGWIRSKVGKKFWLKSALYFGIGMNLLNALFRNEDMKRNPQYYGDKEYSFLDKTMFGNTVGKKTYLFRGRYNDGSERYIRWGKQFRDFFELMINPIQKLGGKVAPVPQLISEMFTGHTMSGFKNDNIYGAEGFKKGLGIVKTVSESFLPISIRRFLDEDIETKPLDLIMQSSKGMSRYNAMEYFKKSIVTGDEELFRDVYVGALRNNLPAYTIFTDALGWTEGEIMSEITKDVKSIEDAEIKLAAATSAYDKRRWGNVVARLRKEKTDKESGLTKLRSALERAMNYKDMAVDKSELHREYGRKVN